MKSSRCLTGIIKTDIHKLTIVILRLQSVEVHFIGKNMSQFVGREEELMRLNDLLAKPSASLVVIYGRRRVGKSRLIEEFGKSHRLISFAGLFPEKNTRLQDQLNEFTRLFKEQLGAPNQAFVDWGDALHALAQKLGQGRVIILLDEISWMAEQDPNFLGKLKNVWDREFKQNDQLILVLCGSVSIWIEKNLLSNKGFYGRISLKLQLTDLLLSDCNQFWSNTGGYISAYEKLKILSVTGGIPKYLEEIRPNLSADDNIKRLCFSPSGLLFNDYDYIFSSLLGRDSTLYRDIVERLSDGRLDRNAISQQLGTPSGSLLSEYLEELVVSGFLHRDHTWHIQSGNSAKLSQYRLADNYLRFYIKYIRPNVEKIKKGQFEDRSLNALPNWAGIMGLQAENLVLNNRKLIKAALGIYPDDVVCDGAFFQSPTVRVKGCQIDYMIQTRFRMLYVCEIKFSRNPVGIEVIAEVQEKIKRLSLPRHTSIVPVLIHFGDLSDTLVDAQFFGKTLALEKLL